MQLFKSIIKYSLLFLTYFLTSNLIIKVVENFDELNSFINLNNSDRESLHIKEHKMDFNIKSDDIIFDFLNDKNPAYHCRPKLVYIKTHKTGSSSLMNFFSRWAINNNKTIAFPADPHLYSFYWPSSFKTNFLYKPSQNYQPDVLVFHSRYSRELKSIGFEQSKTLYVTSLRNSYDQLESIVNFFNLEIFMNIMNGKNLNEEKKITNITKIITIYEMIKKFISNNENIYTLNLLWNPNMFDLSESRENSYNIDQWKTSVNEILNNMDFFIISEKMELSILIIAKLLCIKNPNDLITIIHNKLIMSDRKKRYPVNLVDKLTFWDQIIYTIAMKKLKFLRHTLKISDELITAYKNLNKRATQHCFEKSTNTTYSYNKKPIYGFMLKKNITANSHKFCKQLLERELDFIDRMRPNNKTI